MEAARWQPWQKRIWQEFGFDPQHDVAAAEKLVELLGPNLDTQVSTLAALLEDKTVDVVGCAASLDELQLDRLKGDCVIACDGAAGKLLELGRQPNIVVTDLDGPLEALMDAAATAIMVVHAHGDNGPKLALAKEFPRIVATQALEGPAACYGGFTDGDRAVSLAQHFGAAAIVLHAFDFASSPSAWTGHSAAAAKQKKLGYAREIIAELAKMVPITFDASTCRSAR